MPEWTQPRWLEKAKETYRFHREKSLAAKDSFNKWNTAMTAKALRRSIGSICEDLLIARWCKTHEKELEKFTYTYQALDWIREKQKEQDLGEID